MQKRTIKASILIWSIFLSLIISVTFIGISTKVNKNIKNNNNLKKNIQIQNNISNKLKIKDYTNQFFDNKDKIIFNSQKNINIGLQKDENIDIIVNNNIEITIINGGPIYYSGSTNNGIISNNSSLSSFSGILNIINLGGYTKLQLKSTNNLISKYQKYKIVKTIGNKEVIKTSGKIQNF